MVAVRCKTRAYAIARAAGPPAEGSDVTAGGCHGRADGFEGLMFRETTLAPTSPVEKASSSCAGRSYSARITSALLVCHQYLLVGKCALCGLILTRVARSIKIIAIN